MTSWYNGLNKRYSTSILTIIMLTLCTLFSMLAGSVFPDQWRPTSLATQQSGVGVISRTGTTGDSAQGVPSDLHEGERVVTSPDPTHKMGEGVVTFVAFIGCAESANTRAPMHFCKEMSCECWFSTTKKSNQYHQTFSHFVGDETSVREGERGGGWMSLSLSLSRRRCSTSFWQRGYVPSSSSSSPPAPSTAIPLLPAPSPPTTSRPLPSQSDSSEYWVSSLESSTPVWWVWLSMVGVA